MSDPLEDGLRNTLPPADPKNVDMDICPLCELVIEDDEERKEVWHDAPVADKQHVQGIGEQPDGGLRSRRDLPYDLSAVRVQGRTLGEFLAVFSAIGKADCAEIETNPRVREVKSVGELGTKPASLTERPETDINEGKAGARLTISPPDPPKPDAIMHAECHESIFGDNQ